MPLSFPPHLGPSGAPTPVVPWHDLLPLLPPPVSTTTSDAAPVHPHRPNVEPPAGFIRTVHASPGAWPRSYAEYPRGPNSRDSHPYFDDGAPSADKKERAAQIERARLICGEMGYEAREWDIEEAMEGPHSSRPMWVPIERWRRQEPVEGGVTLIMLHANGMPKEDFHPVIRRMLASSPPHKMYGTEVPLPISTPEPVVNDVFFIEDTLHGVGQDLNAGNLPSVHSWQDYSRDTLNFLFHVLPSVEDNAPWQLKWSQTPAPSQKRTIIGVGHSLGGGALVHASFARPEAFDALFLIEPMTQPTGAHSRNGGFRLQGVTLKRRSRWPSVAAAAETQSNAMFSRFDPETYKIWLSHGLVPTGQGEEVQLATPTWAEAAIFSDPRAPQRGWDLLPKLQCPVGFLMAEDPAWMGGEKFARELVWRPPRARHERVPGAGHLVVQEKPADVARALASYLSTLLSGRWDTARSSL